MSVKFKYLIGTGLGSGLLPKAPGTWGSMASLIPAWAMIHFWGWMSLPILLVTFTIAGFWSAGWFESKYGNDPGIFVIDEWAGQMIPLFIIVIYPEIGFPILFTGAFLLFRLFDITKPFGIDALQQFKGASGIMFDDILAGIYALGTLFFLIFAYYTFF